MRYYAMMPDLDSWSITGPDYPQICDFIDDSNSAGNGIESLNDVWRGKSGHNITTDLSGFKASKDAKITNIMSHPYRDNIIILDDRTLEIFERFNVGEHLVFHATVTKSVEKFKFNVLSIKPNPELLDWSKCLFIDSAHPQFSDYYKFLEWEHFVYERNYLYSEYQADLCAFQLALNDDFDGDCFFLGIYMGGNVNNLVVSQRLKEALIRENTTGVVFRPVIPYFESQCSEARTKVLAETADLFDSYNTDIAFAERDKDRKQPKDREIKHPNYTRQIKIRIEEAVDKGLSSYDAVTRVQNVARFAIESNKTIPLDDLIIPKV